MYSRGLQLKRPYWVLSVYGYSREKLWGTEENTVGICGIPEDNVSAIFGNMLSYLVNIMEPR